MRHANGIRGDDRLALLLLAEMRLRGLGDIDKKYNGKMLLISESDTNYARSLRTTFANTMGGCFEVVEHTYLRGLDGQLPGDDGARGSKTNARGSAETALKGGATAQFPMETPVGRSQYDYLRRLARKVTRDRDPDTASISAVGVLGSDVYDKILVLQALRQQLPNSVFFTTDLDASLLQHAVNASLRNTLIASSFGLVASDDKGGWPPFRDSYQTSLYHGVKLTLDSLADDFNWGRVESSLPPASLYEIGRSEFEILRLKPSSKGPLAPADIREILISIMCYLLILLAFWAVYPNSLDLPRLAILLLIAALTGYVNWWQPVGFLSLEPYSWLQGTSVWPSVVIVFFAALLSFYFLFDIHRTVHILTRDVEKIHFRSETPGTGRVHCRSVEWAWKRFKRRANARQVDEIPVIAFMLIAALITIPLMIWPVSNALPRMDAPVGIIRNLFYVLAFFPMFFLVLRVWVLTVATTGMIADIGDRYAHWVSAFIEDDCKHFRLAHEHVEPWKKIDFIAYVTHRIDRFHYTPFIIASILLVTQLPVMNQWPIGGGFLPGIMILMLIGVYLAWTLRRSAEQAREKALASVRAYRLEAMAGSSPEAYHLQRLDILEDDIRAINRGVYAPLAQQPLIRLIVLILGGSSLVVFQYFFGSVG